MLIGLPILCTILILLQLASLSPRLPLLIPCRNASKTRLSQQLRHRLTLQTQITDSIGNQTYESVLLVNRTYAKVVSVFRNNGCTGDDPLRIDGIDVGVIDLVS